ncbi:MAG TPA: lipid II flippase MurJ [Rhizomicrobium sp.]|nr:lipid II flippase MurJ [Rhizomicrobium sp.]
MNAHRRFALAAAAPALENVGTLAVLGVVVVVYGRTAARHTIPTSLLLLLGLGTTGAVLLHASVQWWGARRVGVILRPNAGWRDPQVRATIRRALPAVVQAGLAALQIGALLVVADRVAGGVVAFQLAMNFYFLPIAIGATPVALSLVPRLSRMTAPSEVGLFRDTYVRGLALAAFLVVPAATGYAVLARPLSDAIGFGAFGASGGRGLIAAALLGLAPAIIGETLFLVTTYACYARNDTTYPLRGMIIHAIICAVGVAAVTQLHGPALLTGLGLAYSASSAVAAYYLVHHLRRGLPLGGEPALRPLLRTLACSAIMAVPAWAAASLLTSHITVAAERVPAIFLVCAGGAGVYFAAQASMRAPQMEWLTVVLRERWQRLPGRIVVSRCYGWRPRPGGSFGILARPGAMAQMRPIIRRRLLDAALLLGPVAVGTLAGLKLKYAAFAVIALILIGWVMARPALAAYLLIFLTPLVAGIDPGEITPVVRPNEALIVLLSVAIGLRWLVRVRSGDIHWPRMDGISISIVALGLTSSVLPLITMTVRQRPIGSDDILYCFVIWKLLAEYVIVRSVISSRKQAMRCLVLSMLAAAIVCFVGILQALNLAGVPHLLGKYYAPVGLDTTLSNGRGGSLLGLPAATADLAILNLAIAIAMIIRGYQRRPWLCGLAVLFALGVVAAAEFSTLLGLVVALIALIALTKSGRLAASAIPVALFGGALLWPVIRLRLSGFNSPSGLPVSWLDRLYNLHTYFWPVLFSDNNWILGVEPAARVATSGKRFGFVWIESGYTWLLWGGGIPLLASYLALVYSVIRRGWAFMQRADTAGIAATAVTVAMCSQAVLMIFDPNLTYRGSGDAFFLILALVRKLALDQKSADGGRQPTADAVDGPPKWTTPAGGRAKTMVGR